MKNQISCFIIHYLSWTEDPSNIFQWLSICPSWSFICKLFTSVLCGVSSVHFSHYSRTWKSLDWFHIPWQEWCMNKFHKHSLFSSPCEKGHVSYCHHLTSVVVNNYTKLFSSETTWLTRTKLGMNVPWGILHRIVVGIFDPSRNMAAITKNRKYGSDSSFSHISPPRAGLGVKRIGLQQR